MFTVVMNLFLTKGGEELVHIGFIHIYEKGLRTCVFMAIRLIYLIIGSSLMTLTTTPNSLTDGIEKLLHPLNKLHCPVHEVAMMMSIALRFIPILLEETDKIMKAQIADGIEKLLHPLNKLHCPVHEVAMMMSIALRFIPILLEETDKIMKAQIARGADLESGNLIQRTKAMVPILVPLFVSAFRRANDLAMAMEARCYQGGDGRTKMKPLIYRGKDYAAYGITFLYFAAVLLVGRFVPFRLWIF